MFAPFKGARYFLERPYLWWRALAAAAIGYGVLFVTFVLTTMALLPHASSSTMSMIGQTVGAIAIGCLASLFVWVVILPLLFSYVYEKTLIAIAYRVGIEYHSDGFRAACFFVFRTWIDRVCALIIPSIVFFIFPSLAAFFWMVGVGYILLLDGYELSMAVLGYPLDIRKAFYATNRPRLLLGGVVVGILLSLSFFTFIGWVFFLPSVYIGCFVGLTESKT